MSFVDSLMDMLKNGGQEDGAATARNNLSQTWDYPSLVAALPYRYYDDTNEIFVNAGSAGFMMEAAPLTGSMRPFSGLKLSRQTVWRVALRPRSP